MRPNPYTKENLMTIPVGILRNIEIENPEEEQIVQEVLDFKISNSPRLNKPKEIRVPDIFTKEQEDEWQEKVDGKRGESKKEINIEQGLPKGVYCSECGTKSPHFHRKGCSKRK